uniref:HasD protein n=1 Tax=Serratia marcescens TaxID=615 RepID=Q53368_SERMA|nr:protease SM transporter [Serratia marcescens]CAA57069.2 hasD [Serratia marcescens]
MSVLAAYRRGFWGIALFTAVINLLMLAPALYMLQVYDRVLPSGNRMTLAMLTLMVVGLYLFMGLLEWVRSQVVIRLGAQMDMRLNQRVYDAAFETNLKTGNPLAGQALNDLTNLRQFATGNALFAFFDAPWFPVYLLVVFLLHPWLGALASAGCDRAGAAGLAQSAGCRKRLSAEARPGSRCAHTAGQPANLRNAEAIAAMGMLTDLRLRWLRQHQQFLLLQNRASEKIAAVTAWSKTVRLALQSLMLGCGALLAVSGDITPGMMIAGSILIGRVLGPIDQLIGAWKQWSSARQSLQRLEVMLAANPPRIPSLPLPAPGGALTVSQLTASAPGGTAPVLHGVSFRLEAGEVLGVIGASGSGKTLLMRQLVGALTPISGDGGAEQLGPHIGYLPQDIQLFAGTLTDNIARFGQVDAEKVVAAAALAGVHQLILHLPKGYETELGEGGSGLSGGQRQRVALARALYGSPALVVLDEPNANLDREGEEALQRAIEALKARGNTIVLVTHKPAILATTDKLLVLTAGQVQHFGPSDAILKKLPGFAPAAAVAPANTGRSNGGFNVNYANFAKTASGERKV